MYWFNAKSQLISTIQVQVTFLDLQTIKENFENSIDVYCIFFIYSNFYLFQRQNSKATYGRLDIVCWVPISLLLCSAIVHSSQSIDSTNISINVANL